MNSYTINKAVKLRNKFWNKNSYIPGWVDINNVGLDQFYTKPEVANKCFYSFINILKKRKKRLNNYKFIDPSVGSGAFYNFLPKDSRVGIDLIPKDTEILKHDFLSWEPKKNGKQYIVIGNPPFGYRAWLALCFINHAAKFADYAAFILPMAFQSDGKGSPKHRVKGMKLIHSKFLPQDSFVDPNGKQIKINAMWQVWEKGENVIANKPTCTKWIDLFTVDERKERLCGQKRLHEAKFFLQRTFYKHQPKLVKKFSEVKYVCGYGLVFKKDEKKIIQVLNKTDWSKYSNLAAHNCRHISMEHIRKAITDAGFKD